MQEIIWSLYFVKQTNKNNVMIIKYELKRTRSHRVDMFPKCIVHLYIWFCTDTCILLIPSKRLTWSCIANLVNVRSIYKIQNINTVHIVTVHSVVSHSVVVQSVQLLWRRSHTYIMFRHHVIHEIQIETNFVQLIHTMIIHLIVGS